MPPTGEALDDDYVISMLKKDAEANQKRYLSNGLGSLLSKRPKGNAPKPNTRFLKNIIRETDSHNAALKAKEEEESKARLKELRGAKRRRDGDGTDGSSKRRRGEEKQGRWANVLGGLGMGAEARQKRVRDDHSTSKEQSASRNGNRRKQDDGKSHDERRHRKREHEHSSQRPRSRSPGHRKKRRSRSNSRSAYRSRSPVRSRSNEPRETGEYDSDSDPLDDIIGPKPPSKSRPRGRGALKSSEMDTRFDPSYNPKTDVNLEPDEDRDDWDMALEALRDRAKWKAQGADRLRAAGFTDEEVSKWEKGGEKDVEDVRWRKKGEGREWDRGKVVDEDGQVEVKAEWGRLKGT